MLVSCDHKKRELFRRKGKNIILLKKIQALTILTVGAFFILVLFVSGVDSGSGLYGVMRRDDEKRNDFLGINRFRVI